MEHQLWESIQHTQKVLFHKERMINMKVFSNWNNHLTGRMQEIMMISLMFIIQIKLRSQVLIFNLNQRFIQDIQRVSFHKEKTTNTKEFNNWNNHWIGKMQETMMISLMSITQTKLQNLELMLKFIQDILKDLCHKERMINMREFNN